MAAQEFTGASYSADADVCTVWVPELQDSTVVIRPGRDGVHLPTKVMLLFKFGSVVFFNFTRQEQDIWKAKLAKYITEPEEKASGPETMKVEVWPEQREWVTKVPDVFRLKRLDMATTRILGLVLAQSVALDTYDRKVRDAMDSTMKLMTELQPGGFWSLPSTKRAVKRQELQQLMVTNSLIYMRVISSLGVLDTTPLAWRQDRYYDVWKSFQDEYEITHRVNTLERKVGPIQENAKFLLQLDHTKQSERSEQTIINLIMIEVLLTILGIVKQPIYNWWIQ